MSASFSALSESSQQPAPGRRTERARPLPPYARPVRVLVTGGTGFIGSHQVVALAEVGHQAIVLDDLSNSSQSVVARLEQLTEASVPFVHLDLRDRLGLARAFDHYQPDAVIHFAARKHVPESVEIPFTYYDVNLGGLLALVEVMGSRGVRRLVFSSSGSVYGDSSRLPIPEDEPHRPTNPYSTTKSVGERVLADVCAADRTWSVMALRYFNPAGAHQSGLIGEDPTGPVSNLLPVLMQVATGARTELVVHGDDFDTPDGTGVRDYVHVMDVARAHLRALEHLAGRTGFDALNVGRGEGVSVLDLLGAVQEVTGRPLPRRLGPRRPGDVAALYADTTRARTELGLERYADLHQICADAWRWQSAQRTDGQGP
jgi:UDP-glucose 4-epimerase